MKPRDRIGRRESNKTVDRPTAIQLANQTDKDGYLFMYIGPGLGPPGKAGARRAARRRARKRLRDSK